MRLTLWANVLGFVSFSLTVVTLTLCAAAFRLAMGPVSLAGIAPIAAQAIEDALAEAAPGWRAELRALEISRGDNDGLRLRLRALRLIEPGGAVAFEAPEIALAVNPAAALSGRFELAAISLVGGRAVAMRDAEGMWRFALNSDEGPASPRAPAPPRAPQEAEPAAASEAPAAGRVEALARLVDAWSGAEGGSGPLASLRRVAVRDADIVYEDALSGATWRAAAARLDLRRPAGGGLGLTMRAAVDLGDGRPPSKISVSAERRPGEESARLTARFERAPFEALAQQFPDLDAFKALRGYVSGETDATFSLTNGDLLAFSAALRGEGAQFAALSRQGRSPVESGQVRAPDDPLSLSAFTARFDYAPDSDRLRLQNLEVIGDRVTAALSGEARFTRDSGGAATGAEGHLAIDRARVLDPALYAAPLEITGGGFDFRLAAGGPGAPRLTLEALSLTTPDVSATGSAAILFSRPTGLGAEASVGGALGVKADVDLALSDFEAARLAALWPAPAAPGGRAWVAANVRGGVIQEARFTARLGGGTTDPPPSPAGEVSAAPKETIDLAFRFSGLESSYLGDMSPIAGGVGEARLNANRFDLTVEAAEVDLGEHGVLRLDGSRFAIPDFEPEIPPSEIEIRSRGPMRALLALIDQEPLAFPRKLGLAPETAEGTVAGVTRLALPLAKDLPIDAVSVTAEGELSNISLPVAQLDGDRASAESATLEVDTAGLRLRGDARIEGFEDHTIWVDWREAFSPGPEEARTRLVMAATLSADELRSYGAPEEIDLSGSARLNAWLTATDGAPVSLRFKAMLEKLGVVDPLLGWRKTPGQAAEIEAEAVFAKGGWRVDRLTAQGPGLTARGAARAGPSGSLQALWLSSFKIDDRIDVAIEMTRDEEGAIAIAGRGPKFDISEIVAPQPRDDDAEGGQLRESGAEDAPRTRLSLDLTFDELTLGAGARLQEVHLAAARAETGRLYADLNAKAGRGVVSASIRPQGDSARRLYRLETDDLGQLLQASAQINAAERGSAVIEAAEREDGSVAGSLTAAGLVVRDAPVLADILSIASVIGIFDLASTGGFTFTQLEAPFVYRDGRLKVDELVAAGPSMGMTLKGLIDFTADQLDLDGTVTPAFVINALPGQVPIIGDLLTGGEGQGVIGVSFSLTGSLGSPRVAVDPLSALTPGPLRNLRRLFGG